MANEREVLTPSGAPITANNEFRALNKQEKKARLARVLERGMVVDRLHVDLPPELYGEWVSDDPVSIASMEAMGFYRDTEYSTKNSLHSTGTQEGRIGDVIFMVCDIETREILEEIRREQFIRNHGKPGSNKQKEETEAAGNIQREGLDTYVESTDRTIVGEQIKVAAKGE